MELINKLIEKSYFPKVESVEFELKKIGILRVLLGIVLFVRFYEITNSLYFFNETVTAISFITMALIVLFTLGVSTPFVTLGLIVFVRLFDQQGSTNTLGTTILIHILLAMLLSNSGQYYSIDGWLLKQKNRISKLFKFPYSIIGMHSKESLTKVYFFIFLFYGLISLGAIGYHLLDPYWIDALTIKSLLSNSYLSNSYESFRYLESSFPISISVLSFVGVIGQSLFQFLMMFLVFNKWGNFFVKWWGAQFFIISLFSINLSYLPHIEILLWLMIFFPISLTKEKVKIIYDDHCNLCKKAMLFFKKYNFNNRFEFKALSKNRELYESNNLTEKEVKTYMVGWYKGKIFKGYDLYFRLLIVNPLFWCLIPFFIVGYITGLGKLIYNFIAERRYKVFGQCELSFEDEIQKESLSLNLKYKKNVIKSVYMFYGALSVVFILISYPFISDYVKPLMNGGVYYLTKKNLYKVGFEIPIVFNETDLSMGDNWMVIYKKNNKGKWEIVPIAAEDGHRLSYEGIDLFSFTNHNSDFLYFGTSLAYRRGIIEVEDFQDFHLNGYGSVSIEKRIMYDYKYKELEGDVEYKVIVYSSNSSKVKHWIDDSDRHIKKLRFKQEYVFDGEILKVK